MFFNYNEEVQNFNRKSKIFYWAESVGSLSERKANHK